MENLQPLAGHSWPVNLRELENVLTAAALATSGEVLDLAAWSPHPAGHL